MKYGKNTCLFALLLSVFIWQSASAGECDQSLYVEDDLDYITMLDEFSGNCLSYDNNDSKLAADVKKLLDDDSVQDDRIRALNALGSIGNYLEANYLAPSVDQKGNAKALNDELVKLKGSILSDPGELKENIKKDLKARWQLDAVDELPYALENMNLISALSGGECLKVSEGKCGDQFDFLSDMVSVIHLVNAAIDRYTQKFRAEALTHRVIRRTSWDSYYDDLTFQYPWELTLNSVLLERNDNRAVVDGNRLGFRELPDDKWVLLHPEVSLVYAKNAIDEYDVAVTVEAIGYESFDFDGKGKVDNSWGVSVLAAYLSEPDKNKSGWTAGLMFKYDSYSLGITDNHGEPGVIFNVNLSQKIFDVKEEGRKYYDEFNQKIQSYKVMIEEKETELKDFKNMYIIAD